MLEEVQHCTAGTPRSHSQSVSQSQTVTESTGTESSDSLIPSHCQSLPMTLTANQCQCNYYQPCQCLVKLKQTLFILLSIFIASACLYAEGEGSNLLATASWKRRDRKKGSKLCLPLSLPLPLAATAATAAAVACLSISSVSLFSTAEMAECQCLSSASQSPVSHPCVETRHRGVGPLRTACARNASFYSRACGKLSV